MFQCIVQSVSKSSWNADDALNKMTQIHTPAHAHAHTIHDHSCSHGELLWFICTLARYFQQISYHAKAQSEKKRCAYTHTRTFPLNAKVCDFLVAEVSIGNASVIPSTIRGPLLQRIVSCASWHMAKEKEFIIIYWFHENENQCVHACMQVSKQANMRKSIRQSELLDRFNGVKNKTCAPQQGKNWIRIECALNWHGCCCRQCICFSCAHSVRTKRHICCAGEMNIREKANEWMDEKKMECDYSEIEMM